MRRTSRTLVASVLALLAIGIVMLASTSSVRASATFEDPYYFLKRQLVWLAISLGAGALLIRFDYHWLQRLAWLIGAAAVVLLALVLVPRVGTRIAGSSRWLRAGPMSVQPSEFAKIAVVVVLSAWMSRLGLRSGRLLEGLLIPLVGLGVILVLVLLEPDYGTTLLVGVVGMLILFAGGARLGHLIVAGASGVCAFILAVLQDPVRMGRVLAFLMPEKYPEAAYHLSQSKVAFIRGEWFGVGLGNSIQKQFYLPEAHTDFILAIIGEELGLLVTLVVVGLFIAILVCGMIITFSAPDPFGRLLAFGMTVLLTLQAAINVGVVTGCLPTKGLALPFISYGGSSLVASVAAISILLNVAGHCAAPEEDDHTRLIKDRAHRL